MIDNVLSFKTIFNTSVRQCLFIFGRRMQTSCQEKCVPPKYHEAELSKGEAVCLDRCVAKYMEMHDKIGKKLTAQSMQDAEAMQKQMAAGATKKT